MRDFVAALLAILHDRQTPYAIGGSVASSFYGEMRATQDIDLSIQLDEADIAALVTACEARTWYISANEVARAAQTGGAFSVNDGFWKADFFVVKNDPFAATALARRQERILSMTGQTAWLLSPEDVIVHKLRWSEGKPLDKHLRDITAILSNLYATLDLAYVTHWAAEFSAGDLWAGLLDAYRGKDDQ